MKMKIIAFISLLPILFLTSCNNAVVEPTQTGAIETATGIVIENTGTVISDATGAVETKAIGMPNPASKNCIDKGGQLITKENKLGQYGVCIFEDNRQCEEWALMRGECPLGGRKITGYDNDAQVFCAITGGEVSMDTTPATCTLAANAGKCSVDAFFDKGIDCVK